MPAMVGYIEQNNQNGGLDTLTRRNFLKILGAGTAAAMAPGWIMPKDAEASSNLRTVPGFVGVPGETYMVPTNEQVDFFINGAQTVTDVIGDLYSDMHRINIKNIGDIHAVKKELIGQKPTMVFVASNSKDASAAGYFKALALSFPEMAKLYVNVDINGKRNQKMSDLIASHFANDSTPATVFYDKSGKRLSDYHRGRFTTKGKFYQFIDNSLPFIAERVLGNSYRSKAIRKISANDVYDIFTPVPESKGFPVGTRKGPKNGRGIYKVEVLDREGIEATNFSSGEFQDYWFNTDYRDALIKEFGIDKKTAAGKEKLARVENIFKAFSESRIYLYNLGKAVFNDEASGTKYLFPIPKGAALRIFNM